MVKLDGPEILKSESFWYLGSIIHRDGEIEEDVNHKISALKGKFYKIAIWLVMVYGTECWVVKKQHIHKMSVVEMRMLRWITKGKIRF